MTRLLPSFAFVALVCAGAPAGASGQSATPAAASDDALPPAVSGVALPAGYVIGTDDVLSIVFWREREMSTEVVVRPDGKVSVPLLNDIPAAGLTPDQLRAELEKQAMKYIESPNASVIVKAIHSRKVHITGNVAKSGEYPLNTDLTVLQLIALAGGLLEWADAKNILVMRTVAGEAEALKFNYKDVVRQKNLEQNVLLRPGDTVIVP
jgi:polysaccharide export outer membrane protein